MPTSLVSTGVQFPDSTIQTTAASGGGGATSEGSIMLLPAELGGTNNANDSMPSWATFATDGKGKPWYAGYVWTNTAATNEKIVPCYPYYSTYYKTWLLPVSHVNYRPSIFFSSQDAINWAEAAVIDYQNSSSYFTGAAVDDLTGNIYAMGPSGTSSPLIRVQKTATDGTKSNIYAVSGYQRVTFPDGYDRKHGATFVNTGNASTSKLLFFFQDDNQYPRFLRFASNASFTDSSFTSVLITSNSSIRHSGIYVFGSKVLILLTDNSSSSALAMYDAATDGFTYYTGAPLTFDVSFGAHNGSYYVKANTSLFSSGTISGTSLSQVNTNVGWTSRTGLSQVDQPYAITWQAGSWYLYDKKGLVYANSSTNPASGTWTVISRVNNGLSIPPVFGYATDQIRSNYYNNRNIISVRNVYS